MHILDPWWNPATEDQAMDRVHRIGQRRPVDVWRYACTDSIEERILTLQATPPHTPLLEFAPATSSQHACTLQLLSGCGAAPALESLQLRRKLSLPRDLQ